MMWQLDLKHQVNGWHETRAKEAVSLESSQASMTVYIT